MRLASRSVVLDSQGLSLLVDRDPEMTALSWLPDAQRHPWWSHP